MTATFDLDRLYEILRATTYAMPHESEAPTLEQVDCVLVSIGVDRARAEQCRSELRALLDAYPEPDRLASGPSYIEVGAALGDQGAAFQLFALGHALGLWTVITPRTLGITDETEARQMAGVGLVMMSGYTPSPSRKKDGGQ